MNIKKIICPNCMHDKIQHQFEDNRYKYSIFKCDNCNLLFKETQEYINYSSLEFEKYNIYNFNRKQEVEELIKIIKKLIRDYRQISLLEIGCGTGSLLNEFRNQGINNTQGIEPSDVAANYARRKYNINVRTGFFKNDTLEIKCDVILLYDVLEHLANPNELFSEISKYIHKDSILIIKTGNTNSVNAKIFPREWTYLKSDQHIRFFNIRSIKNLASIHNFRIIKFYGFKHPYGGIHIYSLLNNVLKGIALRILFKLKLIVSNEKDYGLPLANDHFIAVLKRAD